jgi:ligand-binding sensor domain-containing protein
MRDLNIDSAGKLWFVRHADPRACSIDPQHPASLDCAAVPAGYHSAIRDSVGRLWAANDERAGLFEHGKFTLTLERQRSRESRRAGPLLPGRNGELWFLGDAVRGLMSNVELRNRRDNGRFSPVSGFEDSRGRLWVGSMGEGLIEWTRDPEWQRWFPEDFDGVPATQVVRSQGGAVLATHGNLYRLHEKSDKWLPLKSQGRRFASVWPLEDGGFLASIRKFGLARLSSAGEVLERVKDLAPFPDDYREIIRDGKGRFWVGHRRALYRIEGIPGSLSLREETLPGSQETGAPNPVDLEVDGSGRLWVGYSEGIAWLDDKDRWHRIATDQPVFIVRSFTIAGDDIWVAHRRPGAFSRLRKKAGESNGQWSVVRYAAHEGYGPVDTHFIKRDSRGWIWRGSPEGVHISDGRRFGPDDWIHIHLGNGLASGQTDQYGFFEDEDSSVWIAGADGVSHLRPNPSWFDNPASFPAPRLTRIEADGREFLFPTALPSELPERRRCFKSTPVHCMHCRFAITLCATACCRSRKNGSYPVTARFVLTVCRTMTTAWK